MARLVPRGNEACSNGCSGLTALPEEEEGGCGSSNGRSAGGEMALMEHQLAQNERAAEAGLEVEITSSALNGQRNGKEKNVKDPNVMPLVNGKKGQRPKGPAQTRRKTTRQTMGRCKRCGYLSSQEICKACVLLEGLNKNRPKNEIEVSSHAPEGEHGHMNGTTSAMQKLQLGAD
jgi:cytoplasmic tRNA 2-thiolation protein 1